jgi:hypothetical protein
MTVLHVNEIESTLCLGLALGYRLVYVLASILRSGMASIHLVDLSVAVSKCKRGPPMKEVEDPPGVQVHARGRICVLRLEWREVELPAACEPFHTDTAGSRGTRPPRLCPHKPSRRNVLI